MPVVLSKKGATVKERGSGKVVKKFKSRTAARKYLQARNIAYAYKKGKKGVPKPRRSR